VRRFAALFEALDTTTSTAAKVEAMRAYFATVDAADAAWATYTLMGRRAKRSVGPALLRQWLLEEANLPAWLVEETYASVGDLAETIALLVPADSPAPADASARSGTADVSLNTWFVQRIQPLARQDDVERRAKIVGWWRELPYAQCFLVNKLLTGSLRVGVSRSLVTRALAAALGQPRIQIERALMGTWEPSADFWEALRRAETRFDIASPYPFFLASPLEGPVEQLGDRSRWLAEWKWDGIRGQIVRRAGQCALWSRGEEVVTERFPEIVAAAAALPDGTVLDGEIVAGSGEAVLPFAKLQQRIGRKKLNAALLAAIPARFIAYDLLEFEGHDWRPRPLLERRAQLERVAHDAAMPAIRVSPALDADSWAQLGALRDTARSKAVEGLMLKDRQSAYGSGRQRGAWWKWKIDPYVFDGVLLYAAPGHGRRSNLYTDYTFAVWSDGALVPVAKAYSGLDDAEIRRLDAWIRKHTKEKFGTVRSVEPVHVFELAYEGIAKSSRHKSGIALRFPRIVRWRSDKVPTEADTLADLHRVLAVQDAR
jgi:DNA ligase-1